MENEKNFTVDKLVEVKADLLEFIRLCESAHNKLKLGCPIFLSFFCCCIEFGITMICYNICI